MPLKLFICQRVRLSSGPIRKQFIPGKSRFDKIFEYIVISGGDDYLLPVYLSYINIQPYYVYLHDMVSGAEEFRTTLGSVIELEIELRRSTAGFNMPQFIVDLPDDGGKRLVSSFETYDRHTGISTFRSPQIRNRTKNDLFFYSLMIICLCLILHDNIASSFYIFVDEHTTPHNSDDIEASQ